MGQVVEIRGLSEWSEAQVWVSPEQHGTITAVFKNQIDWIPLSIGSVRPSQGRTLAVAQVYLRYPTLVSSATNWCPFHACALLTRATRAPGRNAAQHMRQSSDDRLSFCYRRALTVSFPLISPKHPC